jgi:hypothetical protein
MKILSCTFTKGLVLAGLLTAISSPAQSGADPDPKLEHFIGPYPWSVDPVQCEAFGADPVMVETMIEELWGHHLGEFNQGFADGSGGWHMVQPAHWIMSAASLGGEYSWWGRAAARAGHNFPSETNGGNFSYVVHSILRADGDWPDLKLKMTIRVVADANGNFHVFDDMMRITCFE